MYIEKLNLSSENAKITSLDFQPNTDLNRLAISSLHQIKIYNIPHYDVNTKNKLKIDLLFVSNDHNLVYINTIRWSYNGKFLASCDSGGTLVCYELDINKNNIKKHNEDIKNSYTKSGNNPFAQTNNNKEEWKMSKCIKIHENGEIFDLSWSRDNEHVVCGVSNGIVYIFNLIKSYVSHKLFVKGTTENIKGVSFHPTNNLIIAQSSDNIMCIWKKVNIYSDQNSMDMIHQQKGCFDINENKNNQTYESGNLKNDFSSSQGIMGREYFEYVYEENMNKKYKNIDTPTIRHIYFDNFGKYASITHIPNNGRNCGILLKVKNQNDQYINKKKIYMDGHGSCMRVAKIGQKIFVDMRKKKLYSLYCQCSDNGVISLWKIFLKRIEKPYILKNKKNEKKKRDKIGLEKAKMGSNNNINISKEKKNKVNKYAQCFLILQNLLEEQTCAVDLSWSDKHNQLIIGGSNGSVYIVQIDISKLNLEPFYHKEYVQINEIFVRHKRDDKIRIEDEKSIIKNKAIRDKIVGDKLFDKIVQRSFEKNADRIDGKKTIENTGEKKVKNRLTPKIKYLYDEYGNIIENSKSHEVIHILKCTIHPLNDDINKYCDFSFLSFNKKDNINIFSNCKKHTSYLTNKMKQYNSDNFANPHLSSFSSFLNDFLYVIISSIYTILQNCDYIWNIIKKGIAHTLHTQISPFTTAPIPSLLLRSVFYKKEVFLKNFIPNECSPFFNNICTFFQFNEILQDGRKHFRRCSYDTDDASRDTGANGGGSKDRSDNGNRGENNGNQNGEPRNSNSGIGGNGGDGDEEKHRNEKNTNEPDEYSNEDNKNNKVTNNNNNTDCKKVEKMSSNTNKKVRKNNKNNTDKQGNNKGVENNNSKKKNCTLINKNKLINNEDNIIKNYNEIINLQSYVIPSNNDQIFASSNSQINTKMIEIIKNSKNSENIKDIDNDIFNIYKNENDKYSGTTSIDHTNYINKYYEGTNNLSHHINSISINMNNDPSKVLENLNNLSDNKITKFIKNISPNKKEKKESKKEKKKVKKQEAQNLGGEKTEGTKQKKSEGKKEKKNEGKKNNKKDSNKVIKGGAEMGNEGKVVKGGKMGKEAKEAKTTKANKGVKDSNETTKSIEIVAEITLNQITEPNEENVPNENNENNETNDQNDQTQTDTHNAPNESNEPNEPNESNEPNEPNEPNGPNESNEPNEPTEPNDPNDPNEPTEENNSTSKKKETSKSQKRNSNKGTKRKSAKNNKKDENGNNSDIEWENFNPHAELFCPIIRKEDNEEEVGYMTYSSPVKFGKETNDSNDLNKQNKNKKRKSVDNINKKKSKNSIEFLSFNDTNENGDNECLDKIMKYNKYEEGEKRNSKIKNENSIFKTEETFDNTKNKEYEEDDDTVENVLKKNSKRMYENMYNSSSVIDKQNYNLKNAHNNLNSSNKYTGEKFMKREAKNSSLNNSTSNIFGRNDYPNEFEAFEIGKEKKKNNNIYLDNYELSQRNLNNKMSPDYYNHNSHSHLDKYSSVENGQDEANNYHTKKFRSNENENYKYHQSYLKREHNTNLNLIDIKKEEFENGSSMYSQEEYNDPTERYGYNSNEFDKYKEMNFKNKKRKAYNKMINGNMDNFDINNVYGSNNIDFIRTKKYNDKMNYISKGYNKRSNKKIRIKNNEDIETVYESNQYILDDMYSNDDIIYSNHGEKKKKMKYIHITNDVQYEKYKNKVIIFDNRKENCLICCMCNNNNNLGGKKNYYLLWEDEISGKNIKYTINDNYIFIISYKFNIFLLNIFSINSKLLIHDYVLPVKYIADFVIIKSFNIDGNIYTFFYIHDKKYYYIYQLLNYSSLFLLYSFEISMLNSHVESININIVEKLQNEAILSKSSKKCFKKYKKLFKNRNKKGSIDEKKIKENREENESSEVENDKPTNSETEQTKVTAINKKRKEKNEKDKEKDLSLKELIHSITFYEKLKIGNKSNVKQHKKCNGFFSKKSIKKGKHQYNMSYFHPGSSNKLLTRIPNKIQNFSSQKEKKIKDTTNKEKKEKTKKNYFDIFSNNIHGNDLLYDYIYRKENFYYSYMCIYIFLKNGMIFLLRRNLMKTEVTNENHLPDAYPSEVISMRPHMFEQNGITLISRLDNIYYNKSLYCDIDLLYNSKNDCSDGIHNKAILGSTNTLNRCLANEYFNKSKNLIMFDNLMYIQQKGMKNFSSQNKIFNIYDFDISKLMESEEFIEEHETVGHYFEAVVKEEKVNTDDDDNINKYDKIESNKNNFISQNGHIKKELNIVSDDFLRAMNISEAFKKHENNSTSHIDTNIYIKTIKYLENQMKYSILIMNKKSFLNYLYAYFSFLVEYLDITRIQQNFQYFMKITLFHLKKYISNFVFFNIDQDTNHEPYWLDTNALLCMNIHFFFLSLFLYYNFLLPIYKILRQKKKKNTHIHKYHSFFRFIKEMHKCMVQIDTVFQRAFHRSLSL